MLAARLAVGAAAHAPDATSEQIDPLFAFDLGACSYGGASAADLDGDGDLELLFGTYQNDERVIALHHDGTIAWTVPSDGGPVDNSVTAADLNGDGRPEVMWGDSGVTTFHVADASGRDLWTYTVGEVLDAPEAIGDLDGDGDLDIALASCGKEGRSGGLRAFDGASGELLWTARTGGCYQSAPLLFDQDADGVLDIVVSTWFDNKVRGFSGLDGALRWEAEIGDQTYHAGSFGDLNGDLVPDVALGDFSAQLWAIDGTNGDVLWSDVLRGERYIFGPTAMADVDGDGTIEVIVAGDVLHTYSREGEPMRSTDLPGYATRGPVLSDLDADGLADVVLALPNGRVLGMRGLDHAQLYDWDAQQTGDHDFQPAVADLDGDGSNEVFTVFGRGRSDTPEQNWGRAVALSGLGTGSSWPTFSHDHHHSGNYHRPPGDLVNRPAVPTSPEPTTPAAGTPVATSPTSTTPATGTPVATSPASATPATGTPVATNPASTTPATGTPVATSPATPTPPHPVVARLFVPRLSR